MKKRLSKIIRKVTHNNINGVDGLVSVFLALVMTPFLSSALLLVESSRIHNATQLMEEMLDMLGVSELADYDSYLESRFGLLSMNQKTDRDADFSSLVSKNESEFKKFISIDSSKITSLYALSEDNLFRREILDYCEVSALIELLYNGLNVDKLIESITEQFAAAKKVQKVCDATSKVADAAASIADLLSAIKDSCLTDENYKKAKDEYSTAITTFHTSSETLINALSTANDDLEEGEDLYSVDEVKNAVKDANTARDDLVEKTKEARTQVIAMREKVEGLFSAIDGINEKFVQSGKAIEDLGKLTDDEIKKGNDPNQASVADSTSKDADWEERVLGLALKALKKVVDANYSNDMNDQADALLDQQIRVSNIVFDKSDEKESGKYYVDISSSIGQVKSDFPQISLESVKSNYKTEIENTLQDLDDNEATLEDEEAQSLGKLIDLALAMLNISAFANGELDANVSPDVFISPDSMAFSDAALIETFRLVIGSAQDLVDGVTKIVKGKPGEGILQTAKALAEFLGGVVTFLASIVGWVVKAGAGLVGLVANHKKLYSTILIASYGVYNLPCRTTYKSGKSLSGYSYSKIFNMQGGTNGDLFTGMLDDLVTLGADDSSGTDSGFRGAESEYLLIGSKNEMQNQCAAFFNIYMLRLAVDIAQILTNKEVQAEAGAASIAAWVVYVAIIIAEPMIDTLLLVNGQDQNLIKKEIYLTPTGGALLLRTLPNLLGGLGEKTKNDLSDYVKEKTKKVGDDGKDTIKDNGMFPMSYQEHIMVLLFLMTSEDKMVSRLKNIVNMEAKQKYKGEFEFDFNKTYTAVNVEMSGTFKTLLGDQLIDSGILKSKRSRFVSY